ncbi:hypothetical protein [Endozoicomonas sp. YOMI1]|uniref:hypothetical protein n=1 Tax=Endozoicomonas sp. YOMI1 TaxID=2828739 RepID=UPI00214978EA|nr:hypothetical protein [Endozoicomonas sp. YOMI1]
MNCDFPLDCEKAETDDPKLSFLETPANTATLTLDAVRLLMDAAVRTNNFPAMWQLKIRYGITLSAAQLKDVLWHTLPPQSFHVYVIPSADNKVRMALDLMTHDDASKRVVSDFLQEVLKKKGHAEMVVNRLAGSKILNENAQKEALDFFVSIGVFDEVKALKEQYGLSLNNRQLKELLLKVYASKRNSSHLQWILSSYDKDNKSCIETLCEVLRTVATQQQEYSRELLDRSYGNFFDNYMEFINTLLSHDVKDQTAVDAAMTKAVSTLCPEGLTWAGQLKTNYQATMDPAKLEVAIDKAVDERQFFLLKLIVPLFTSDEDADMANNRVLEKLASKLDPCYEFFYRMAKNACNQLLEISGCSSQKALDTLIKKAIENRDIPWASELNSKYDAYLDIEMFESHICKEVMVVKRCKHTDPYYLGDLITSLRFFKADNPNLPGAIEKVVDRIRNMEKFPLQQNVVDKLRSFLADIHPPLMT